jgi:DNA-binding MarR family transcriptional regulator
MASDPPSLPRLGLLLRMAHQQWAQEVDAALTAAGFGDLRPPHANVFPYVREAGIQVSELAQLAGVRKQSMAHAVEQLERMGYLERRPDPNDRRGRLVFLTARGQGVREVAVTVGRRVHARWAEIVGDDGLEAIGDVLTRLIGELRGPGAVRVG